MKSNRLLIFSSMVFVSVLFFVDQWSKKNVSILQFYLGHWFGFQEVNNTGIFLGYLSDFSSFVNIVGVNTFGAFLILVYLMFFYLNRGRQIFIHIGVSFVFSGIAGNWYDRLFRHYVIDFISVKLSSNTQIIFNLADVFIWIGFILVLSQSKYFENFMTRLSFFKNRQVMNSKLDRNFLKVFIFLACKTGFVLFIFSYSFLRVALFYNRAEPNMSVESKILNLYWLCYGVTFGVICLFYWLAARLLSRQISGQIFAFERYINQMVDADFESQLPRLQFRLRKNDELKSLESIANKLLFKLEMNRSKKQDN